MAVSLNIVGRYEARPEHRAAPPASPDPLDRSTGIGITTSIAPGQTIVVEGDPIECCYRVVSGAVRLFKSTPDGRRQVIDFLITGEYFGLSSGERYGYSVEAIAPATLARYPRARLEAAMAAEPELTRRVFRIACVELERAQQHLLLLGRKSADEKVASFLLTLALRLGDGATRPSVVRLPMSRQDMADYLGLTIETVSRTLTRLRREGLIALPSPQQVILRRPAELAALAIGDLAGSIHLQSGQGQARSVEWS
jgi:CRP/FNR family transcriptional regulator, anaerobic regulatory protein